MIGELVSATVTGLGHALHGRGSGLLEAVAAALWGSIAVGIAYSIPKFKRLPEKKRPLGCWCLPVFYVAFIWNVWHFLLSFFFALSHL